MKEIILSKGAVAKVDDSDYDFVNQWKWTLSDKKNGTMYARRSTYGETKGSLMLHRVILGITDPKVQVDHIDRNGLNNQRSNLRVATQSQNNANRRPLMKRISRYLGVHPNNSKKNPWRARLQVNGKKINLGSYANQEQAALAYNVGAKKHFGEFATFNNLCSNKV